MKTQKRVVEQEAQYIIIGGAAIVAGLLLMAASVYLTQWQMTFFRWGGMALLVIGGGLMLCSLRLRPATRPAAKSKAKKGNGKK